MRKEEEEASIIFAPVKMPVSAKRLRKHQCLSSHHLQTVAAEASLYSLLQLHFKLLFNFSWRHPAHFEICKFFGN